MQYSQLKWDWIKENTWLPLLMSIPVTWTFIKVTNMGYEIFDGKTWPVRFIGFSVGMIVFTACSKFILDEVMTPKTIICLLLCIVIIILQLFWKN